MKKRKVIYKNIFGVNASQVSQKCNKLGYNFKTSLNLVKLDPSLISFLVTNTNKKELILKEIEDNISKKIKSGNYKGYLHVQGLPVNGQNTHNNRKTQRKLAKTRIKIL